MTIPARLHFCWIGTSLPWAYVFAILSASERSELPEIILHHTDDLEDGDELLAVKSAPRVRLSLIDPASYLTQTGQALGVAGRLAALYTTLDEPVKRADVLRAAILYSEGGIYLDLDTITIASLLPLTETRGFVGTELIVWPDYARRSRSPIIWAHHLALDVLRKILRQASEGWRAFRHVEKFYVRQVNNAAMGAEASSGLLSAYLLAMLDLSHERRTQRYALGPDLLHRVVRSYPREAVIVYEPPVFYPLPPEISEHWFRIRRRVALGDILSDSTRVVHWYASVRSKHLVAQITPAYVLANQGRQLYSALVRSYVSRLPDPA